MATEILRPNGAGSECNIDAEGGCPACPSHWQCVDEESPDDNTTYVREGLATSKRDLYALSNPTGSGIIDSVAVYFRCGKGEGDTAYGCIRSNGVVTQTTGRTVNDAWQTHSQSWALNPANGEPWEWSDIISLQAGVKLSDVGGSPHCTQVYVRVTYTPPAGGSRGYIIG